MGCSSEQFDISIWVERENLRVNFAIERAKVHSEVLSLLQMNFERGRHGKWNCTRVMQKSKWKGRREPE